MAGMWIIMNVQCDHACAYTCAQVHITGICVSGGAYYHIRLVYQSHGVVKRREYPRAPAQRGSRSFIARLSKSAEAINIACVHHIGESVCPRRRHHEVHRICGENIRVNEYYQVVQLNVVTFNGVRRHEIWLSRDE